MEADRRRQGGYELDVADLKARTVLSEVIGRAVVLRRSGTGWSGLCPFHEDRRPSLSVSDDTGLWYCHACAEGGDVVTFVMRRTGCRFVEALEWLADRCGRPSTPRRATGDAARAAAVARRRRTVFATLATAIWRSARPVPGTPAERYLASRGIVGPVPGTLRFTHAPTWIDDETGEQRLFRPALVAACQDVDGVITGIHRTFLTPKGEKARMDNPKLSLGQIRGGALRLGPEARDLMLVEGLEDGLSLQRMFVGATVWATLGAGNLPHANLPADVRRVVLAGDNDEPGVAAVKSARIAYEAQGREVAEMFPRAARDFNEEWLSLHS